MKSYAWNPEGLSLPSQSFQMKIKEGRNKNPAYLIRVYLKD